MNDAPFLAGYSTKVESWKGVRFRTGNMTPMEYVADKNASSVKYMDATKELLENATAKNYDIEELMEIKINEIRYTVDGINVMHCNSQRELAVAEMLKTLFDDKIKLVPEVKGNYKNVRTPDYLIGNKKWDLKSLRGESKDAVRNAIKVLLIVCFSPWKSLHLSHFLLFYFFK